MKRLMMLAILGAVLSGTTGCRVVECWRYAWNSRFHPQQPQQQAVICADPCDGGVVVESGPAGCSSCAH